MPSRPEPQPELGRAIRKLRRDRDLSQEALARSADLHATYISRLEAGTNPAWGTVRRVADGLGVRVSEIALLAEELEERKA